MPELRKDPISDRWVIISTERGRRPSDFGGASAQEEKDDASKCPLCEGNEDKTPPEIISSRKSGTPPNTPGWSVRVVANKFPALVIEGDVNRSGIGIFDMMSGIGAHEVIVETPKHDLTIADMKEEQIDKVLWAYKQRITDLSKDQRFRYILVFKNYGKAAGASLSHPHSQLIATPITPRYIKLELTGARQYFQGKERCLFCDLVRQELGSGERLVYENEYFVAFEPFASRFPFETWILPRRHYAKYQEISDEERLQLASCMKDIMMRLKKTLNDPPYNYVVHTAPNPVIRPGKPDYWGTIDYDFHWHIEIIPRLTKTAGFEWGSGLYINPTSPEEAAKYLREII
ncbi:galactose-1-phosphate uridylyltransferase [candidate division WOR-1 bacterium RIFOXYD2_FULL_36_8]|uniref:Galactose-1-phosphate uridylyltransferase n=1 Tax=candidate division WOR-1 bacterium RIFOXYB2_FULL_36_35 TaxID=1802578 RepID=A0A1F4S6G5_UNCSA|nr:MAG: galactose-1-phosphate uridylyltransferase [candidate division WOR-1 bacterium RIFOXYA2_FULL_36_21]OGC14367.1 MAG: galactose-1-phosphate uridylyltransferase [candidate division WOR-1 bacterium RIFOXYA12_FULL_36_13]OGC15957.1 MAG: galactose-1-phosphate uridylyltransferase [candidate division WOR-1 bacterium RIFOXYB2_FULL_36_35]OGC40041.1 MAG: galactose-1-phosphate uridylyltransferase [candidate division WOR-1 bacterium RIFOXYD2_FULL_36_8]